MGFDGLLALRVPSITSHQTTGISIGSIPTLPSTTAGVTGITTTASAPLGPRFSFQEANQDYSNGKIGAN